MGRLGDLREGVEAMKGRGKPRDMDPAVMVVKAIDNLAGAMDRPTDDSVAEAIKALGEALSEAIGSSDGLDEVLTAAIRAQGNYLSDVMKESMQQVAETSGKSLAALVNALPAPVTVEPAQIVVEPHPSGPVEFVIQRDSRGFIETVTATPIA